MCSLKLFCADVPLSWDPYRLPLRARMDLGVMRVTTDNIILFPGHSVLNRIDRSPSGAVQVIREVKDDVYGKQQDEISFLPKHGET